MKNDQHLRDYIIFEDYPYQNSKTIKVGFWIIFIGFIIINIVCIFILIEGIKNNNLVFAIITFTFNVIIIFPILSYRNRRLRIYFDCISINSIWGKEKVYFIDTKQITIQVKYKMLWKRGFKLLFFESGQKICSYTLIEPVTTEDRFNKRRKDWGARLKNVCQSIEGKDSYLLDGNTKNQKVRYMSRERRKKNNMKYHPVYSIIVIFFCTTFIIYSVISHLKYIPLEERDLITVKGTVENFGSFNRYYNIQINEDNIDYNIVTIYRTVFNKKEFEKNIQIGDSIQLICSDYMGDTMFVNSNITKASIYSIKVNDTIYMSMQDSIEISREKQAWSNVYPNIFIPSLVIIFQLGMITYYFIDKKRISKNN